MGYMKAHTIVVESWDEDAIKAAHAKAVSLFHVPAGGSWPVAYVSEITGKTVNRHRAFFVAPDGSKEEWDHSNIGDNARKEFREWLRSKAYDDGSTSLRWVEVMFADDEGQCAIVDHDAAEANGVIVQ